MCLTNERHIMHQHLIPLVITGCLLTGCAAQGNLRSQLCDPSGLCHSDTPLALAKPVLIRTVADPGQLHPKQKDAYAFALIDSGPYCQVFMPQASGPYDARWHSLLWHELRHCAEGNYHG